MAFRLTLINGDELPEFMHFDNVTVTLQANATEVSHAGLYQLRLYTNLIEYPEALAEESFEVLINYVELINNSTSNNQTVEEDEQFIHNSTVNNATQNSNETSDSQIVVE